MEAGGDKSLFVAFDSAMTKLTGTWLRATGIRAAEVANPMDHDDQVLRGYQLPRFFQNIVGNAYIFHLKLKSFTVARIFNHNERIQGPAFAPNTSGNNPDDDMD